MNTIHIHLRTEVVRAIRQHRCDVCEQLIFPGDLYLEKVEVKVVGKHREISVKKEHEFPSCPFPYEDADDEELFELCPLELPLAA